MARPKRGNYATGPAGDARYKKNLREYLKKQKELQEKKTKIDSTKKNIEKQKTANKKATTTTKTTKGTTTTKPKSTAAKGKSLATGKTTSKTKAVETPQTTTATKTRTRTRTQTKSKSTTKTTPKSKTPAKTTLKSKTPAKTTNKQPTKQPAKRGRPVGSKNKPKGNQNLKIAKETAGKTGKFLKEQGKKALDTGKKQYGKLQTKLAAKDQTPQQANPEPKTKGQKLMSRLNKSYQAYKGEVKAKAGETFAKSKDKLTDKSLKGQRRTGARAALAMEGGRRLTDALFNRLGKPKDMTVKEYDAAKKKMKSERNLVKDSLKIAKRIRNKFKGKSGESSTTKNINKQKKVNKNQNNSGLKIKKTYYSGNKNYTGNKDYNAKTATKTYNPNLSTFRVDPDENRKLQLQIQNQGNKKNKTETYSRVLSRQAKKNKSNNTTTSNSPKPGSARAKLRAKNEARFGKAHVDKLRAKNKDFQAMKKKKMTKAEFIRRYPNSITAQKAKGLRK
jgi:hypothetical protein